MTEEKYQEFLSFIETICDAQEEYETEHDDAGGNYDHLPQDGDTKEMLSCFLDWYQVEIPDGIHDDVIDMLLNRFEPEPGHIFSSGTPHKFILDSYSVGEIEIQIDFATVADALEISTDDVSNLFQRAFNERELCGSPYDDYALVYVNTDAVWLMAIDKETVDDGLRDIVQNQIENCTIRLWSDRHGIYLPKITCELILENLNSLPQLADRPKWPLIIPPQKSAIDLCKEIVAIGPEHEHYWDTWDDFMSSFEFTVAFTETSRHTHTYMVVQNGDVLLVDIELFKLGELAEHLGMELY